MTHYASADLRYVFHEEHVDQGPKYLRPVVVIDPEDMDLAKRVWELAGHTPADFQAALREFANPKPPKPDEPTGLGAVVEDKQGTRWVLDNPAGVAKWSPANAGANALTGYYKTWERIAVVRVLSEGVVE